MSGTQKGGKTAAKTNVKRHGKDFYARIGAMGGKKSRGGGFAANRDLARLAGAKGGRISRRRKTAADTAAQASATQNDFDLTA
ncbi:MAG TPA: hypothetical protein VFZ58_02615 [Candidatus Saccharimonadales bacterium]